VPGVKLVVEVAGVPLFGFHVIVTGFTVHLAQYVVLTLGTMLVLKICVPPVAAVNHPAKVCPDRVGVGNVPN